MAQVEYFTQELRNKTLILLDATTGGRLRSKSNTKVKESIKNMAQNEYYALTNKGAK